MSSDWNADRTHKKTNTIFDLAGYDYDGFNEFGYNKWGLDAGDFNEYGVDKFGNHRGTGLKGFETRILLICSSQNGPFHKSSVITRYDPAGTNKHIKSHIIHSRSFDSLVTQGYIATFGSRHVLTKTGRARVRGIRRVIANKAKRNEQQ